MTQPPFTRTQQRALAVLPRVCADIRSCRFVRDLPRQDHSTRMRKQPDGTWLIERPDYDVDDFRSFLTIARKLIADRESTCVFKLLDLIGRHGSEEDRKDVKEAKATLAHADKPGALRFCVIEPGTGKEFEYSATKLLNIVCNAEIFHSAEDLEPAWLRIRPHREDYLPVVLGRVLHICRIALWVEGILKEKGWLPKESPS
jgi:hypothetical protein